MTRFTRVLIALVALALLAAPASALAKAKRTARAAASCGGAAGRYDTGGKPGTGFPNDPLYSRQWGLKQINAPAAWKRGVTGQGVTIAVIDTGVDFNHPDLKGHLVQGYDFVHKDSCAQDAYGHGTHVAGIAAAITNNGIGVAGTAPNAKIMPVRVLDDTGSGTTNNIVKGIRYAASHGAKVLNLSLGEMPVVGEIQALNQDLEDAINYAWKKGAVVVASAGNDTFPLCEYPSFAEHALCIGATDSRGLPSYYSNFPNKPNMLGFRAPGGVGSVFCEDDEDIWSTMWPKSDFDSCGDIHGYETLAGTSMAAPFVSGVAALLFSQHRTNQQVVNRLIATSSNHGTWDPVMGYGIVNAGAATGSSSAAARTTAPRAGALGGALSLLR